MSNTMNKIPPPPPGYTLDHAPGGEDWFAQNAPPANKPAQVTEWDINGNPVVRQNAVQPIEWDINGNPVVPLEKDWFAANAPGRPIQDKTTIGPQHQTTAADALGEVARIPTDMLGVVGDALDTVTSEIENYDQQGRKEHPILANIGDVTRSAKELLFGGQAVEKPMGTTAGVTNNPVTVAMSFADVAPQAAALTQRKLVQAVDAVKAAREAKLAQASRIAPKVAEVNPEHFVYREPTPAPQHGTPVKVASPLDNATINRLPGGKDLSPEAISTLKAHIRGTPGAEIEIGSTPKNTLMKAVEPVQKTLTDTGIKMNQVIHDAPAFKSSIYADGKFGKAIDAVRENLPGGDEGRLNAAIDKEIQSADSALKSTDPSEVLAYRRKLGSQIDWNDIARNPETPGQVQNVTKVKLYHALGEKIHAEIPDTVALDKVFQPNLEVQSHLDAKLGRAISRDPVEANAQRLSELNKGKTQIENEAHNAVVTKNRELAGLDTSDVRPSIGNAGNPPSPVQSALEEAVSKFNAPPIEREAIRKLLQPNVRAGKVFGTNTSWYDGLKAFDNLSPQEQAARFSNPGAIRAVLQKQAKLQLTKAVVKYGSVAAVAHALGIDKAVLQLLLVFALIFVAIPCSAQQIMGKTQVMGKTQILAPNPVTVTGGWAYLQADYGSVTTNAGWQVQGACGTLGATACTLKIFPTTAGSVLVIGKIMGPSSGNHITSAFTCVSSNPCLTGSGDKVDTFSLCPSSTCLLTNTGNDHNDAAYVINGAGGASVVTVNVSGAPSSFDDVSFKEVMPPNCNASPCTVVVDNSGNGSTSFNTGSCAPCTGPTFTVTGTDAIVLIIDTSAPVTSPSAPYILDFIGDVLNFDTTSGTAITLNTTALSLTGLAFKTTTSYSPAPSPWSDLASGPPANHFTGALTCSPGCPAITLPVTVNTANTLIFLHEQAVPGSTQTTIASILDNKGNSYTVPTAANTCKNTASTIDLSCGWSIISTTGVTSVTPTMNANTTAYFAVYLVTTSSGVPVLDVQNSSNSSATSSTVTGQTLSPTGSVDVCFAEMGWPGTGTNNVEIGAYLYPSPQGANFFGQYLANSANGTSMMLLNARNGNAPKVMLNNSVTSQASSGACFTHT